MINFHADPVHLASLTASEASRLIAGQKLSPVDLLESYLSEIERQDPELHSFSEVYSDDARMAAAAADKAIRSGHRIGPLHGIPVAFKDLVEIEGRIVTGGSAYWRDRMSSCTATVVRHVVEQGGIILGKTNMVEFALGGWGTNRHMGTPRNPWDMNAFRAPGGSSSGSGVAVAAGMTPLAIGSDTGGSIRVPSAWCGLSALKASVGRVSNYGVLPLSPTLDTLGPMARDIDDVEMLYSAIIRSDASNGENSEFARRLDPSAANPMRGLRLCQLEEDELVGVEAEVVSAYHASLEDMVKAGAELVTAALPFRLDKVAALNALIFSAEGYSIVGRLVENMDLPLDDDVRRRISAGGRVQAAEYLQALYERERMQREFTSWFRGFDAILTPTVKTAAPLVDDIDQTLAPTGFTRFVNFLDLCAVVVPNGMTMSGLPLSLQIVAKNCCERDALCIGRTYQKITDWHKHRPT